MANVARGRAEQAIQARICALQLWLEEHGTDCEAQQRHLDEGTPERAYWHHGYAAGLRDVLRLLREEEGWQLAGPAWGGEERM